MRDGDRIPRPIYRPMMFPLPPRGAPQFPVDSGGNTSNSKDTTTAGNLTRSIDSPRPAPSKNRPWPPAPRPNAVPPPKPRIPPQPPTSLPQPTSNQILPPQPRVPPPGILSREVRAKIPPTRSKRQHDRKHSGQISKGPIIPKQQPTYSLPPSPQIRRINYGASLFKPRSVEVEQAISSRKNVAPHASYLEAAVMDRTKNAPEQSQWLSKSQTTIIHNAPYSSSESNLESKMALFTKEILDRHDESSRNLKRNVNVMLKSFESNLDDLKLLIDFIRKTSLHQQKVAEGTLRFFKQEFSSFPSSNSPLMVKIGSVKDSYQAAAQSRLSACQEIVTLSLSPMQSFVDTAQVKFKELTKTLNSAMDSIAVLRHEAEQGAVACQNCIKNIEDLKTRIGSLPSFVVSKQLKSNASKAQRVFSKYEQDLKALNAERNKISKFLLPLLLAELESLEKDRLMLLHNRLSNIEKLHQQVFDDEKMVLRMFLESKNTVEPLGFLRSWSSVFSHNFQVANGSSTSPLSMQLATLFQSFAPLDDFEEPIDWIPTQQLSDVESAMKELLADLESKGSKSGLFSTKKSPTGVPEKVDGADQTSDSLGQSSHSGHPGFNFTLDKYSVFCHAIRDFESAGKVKFVKGDIIKLSKIPSRNETVLFGEVINHTPPYTAVWFSRAFVSVETQLKADVSLQQLLHCEVGQRYFYEYLKSEHSEEHLLFWILCNEYWNSPSSRQGSKLINAFIAESAPQPVNISGELRASLLLQGRSGSWPQDMFLPAQLEIFNMLKADNFIRFRHSSTFKHMLEDINSALHLKFSQSPTSP